MIILAILTAILTPVFVGLIVIGYIYG